jgi:hypothetical protein
MILPISSSAVKAFLSHPSPLQTAQPWMAESLRRPCNKALTMSLETAKIMESASNTLMMRRPWPDGLGCDRG